MTQDWSSAPTAATKPKGGAAIWTGAVLLLVGVVLVVVGIVGVAGSVGRLVTGFGSPVATPAAIPRTLDGGTTYVVYQRVRTSGVPVGAEVTPADVTVSGPLGEVPAVGPGALDQTFSNGSAKYAAVASFVPPVSGSYTITVSTDGAEVLVAPSFASFGRSLGWVGAIGLGGLLGLAGLVTLIVGLVRRSSSKRPAAVTGYAVPGAAYPYGTQQVPSPPPSVAPPPGWYPDPGRPGGQRYWDGSAWTGHTA